MAKKKKASLGCLFWVALILLVLVVFFFNRERINTVLDETGFRNYLFTQDTQEPEVQRVEPEAEQPSTQETEQQDSSSSSGDQPEAPRPEEEDSESGEDQQVEITVDQPEEDETASPDGAGDSSEEPRIDKRMRKSALYFVEITDSGSIKLQRIIRPIYYTDSPLTQTLQALIEGLTAEELNQGLLNLIPQNAKILRIWVENSIAYIDFTEAFRFNQFGTEGLHTQLRQIVYTATEFQTVDAVQILIHGNKIDYLASEGIFVGKPLTRENVARSSGE